MQIGRMLHKLIRIPCICLSDNFIKLTLALAQNARRYNIFVTFGRMLIQCWFVLFSILLFFYFFRGKRRDRTGRWRKKSLSLSFSLYLSICLEAVVFIMNRSVITFSSVYVLRARQKYYHDFISYTQFTVSTFVGQMSLNRYNPIQFHLSSFFLYIWIWWWSLALILECKNQIEKKQLFCFHFSLGKLLYQVHYLKSVRQTTQNSNMDPFKCIYSCMNS